MTQVTLRPNGTIVAASSVSGAASTHAATSDNSDASFYQETSGQPIVNLGTFALGTGRTKQWRLRGRWAMLSTPATLLLALQNAAGGQLGILQADRTVSIATSTGAWTPATLDQATIDGLRLSTACLSGASHRVYELYLDLMYVEAPDLTVSAVSPDPWETTSSPPISWTPDLDPDGGPQTHYQVRVIDTATLPFPDGVHTDTAPAAWDSGYVASSATSTHPRPLPNGTYRAYVRVAQLVNGSAFWSPFKYDEFTIDVDGPTVESVSVVADDATASVAVHVEWAETVEPEFVEVERSDDYDPLDPDSATWLPVRGATRVLLPPPLDFDPFDVVDYEAPPSVDVVYRARGILYVSGIGLVGEWAYSTPGVSWSSASAWLKVPGAPELNQAVDFPSLPARTYTRPAGRFHPPRRQRPIVVTDVRHAQAGQYTFLTYTEAQADTLFAALQHPVVLLQGPPGLRGVGSRYLFVGDVTDTPGDGVLPSNTLYGAWTVSYEEVDRPPDPDAGSI